MRYKTTLQNSQSNVKKIDDDILQNEKSIGEAEAAKEDLIA